MTDKDLSDIVIEIWKRMAKFLFWMVNKARKLNLVLHFEGGFSVKGDDLMLTLTSTQKAALSVTAVDAKGNPAPVENVVFIGSDPAVAVVQTNASDPTKATVFGRTVGTMQVRVTADADIGEGEKELAGLLDVEIVAAEAVALGITAGTPEEQIPEETTITEPPHVEAPIAPGLPYPVPHGKKK